MRRQLGFHDAAGSEAAYRPRIEACYLRTWKDYHMLPHYHQRAEIMYVIKGSCVIRYIPRPARLCGRAALPAAREATLHSNEFVFFDANVIHSLDVSDACCMANVEFSLEQDEDGMLPLNRLCARSQALSQLMRDPPYAALGTDGQCMLCRAMTGVIDNYLEQTQRVGSQALHELQTAEMLLRLADALNGEKESAQALYTKKALAVMRESFAQALSAEDIARAVGLNVSYLQRVFKQTRGETLVDCLTRLRVNHAKLLLANTRDSILDVAACTGFRSRQYFQRVFSKHTGLSPSAYRRRHQRVGDADVFLFDGVTDVTIKRPL